MSKIAGSGVRISTMLLAAVALGADNDILVDTAMDVAVPTEVAVFDGQPDVARNVTVKGNDANVSGDVIVTGIDALGGVITETITLNGATLVAGSKAFTRVDLVELPIYNTANTERVRVGLGAKLGLPLPLSRNTVMAAFLGGVREGAAPTVATSAAAVAANTATLNSALDGSAVIVDFYETI